MGALGSTVLNLLDWAKLLDPNGKSAEIVEMLGQTNSLLDDMKWMQGNLATGHQTTIRTGLPTVSWALINQGVAPSKSTTAQVVEATGRLEAWSEVDEMLAKLGGNPAGVRLSEGKAFVEAMNQEMASTLIYGNSGLAPEEITGLAPRYSSLSAANAQNIIDAGGTDDGTDCSSIWLICWGDQSIFGIFPQGSMAGLKHDDFGLETVETSAAIGGNRMRAYRERWQWQCGIALKDWRYVVRIANIDNSALAAKTAAVDLLELMAKATHRIPNLSAGSCAFYMNRTVFQYLDIQAKDQVAAGGGLSYENVGGKRQSSFRGIPVRVHDALLQTESRVT